MISSEGSEDRLSRRAVSAYLTGSPEAIAYLRHLFFRYWFYMVNASEWIDWAVERLQHNEEGDDLDIVMLAAMGRVDKPRKLIERIFEKYSGLAVSDEQLIAGKFVVLLRERYLAGLESIDSLDHHFRRIFYSDMIDWMMELMRICEYTNALDLGYLVPFEHEFEYIAGLWAAADSVEAFKARWDPDVSERNTLYNPDWHRRHGGHHIKLPAYLKAFVDRETWTFAKTYAGTWPHEYLVRERVDEDLFVQLVLHIREFGYEGRFYHQTYTYFKEDGLVYWTMGAPIPETTIVNRCTEEQTYEYRLEHGTLPRSKD
jgi:hypothetical protein